MKLIIFDLDGTLVNAYPAVYKSVNFALENLGFSRRSFALIKSSVGWGDRQLMAQFVGEDLADKAIRLYRPHHGKALMGKGGVRFLPGALSVLRHLKTKGYLLAIASNRPTRFTKIILRTLACGHLFDRVLCADKAKRPKPYPDMLYQLVKEFGLRKTDALYVGDMVIDIKTGHAAGIKTIAVATGSSTLKELKALKPGEIIVKIAQLKDIIKEK